MNILLQPLKTEKSLAAAKSGKFTFRVVPTATKSQIKKAVEKVFSVDVLSVWTVRAHGETKKVGKFIKKTIDIKKAIVELKKGQTIPLFETEKKKGKRKTSNKL